MFWQKKARFYFGRDFLKYITQAGEYKQIVLWENLESEKKQRITEAELLNEKLNLLLSHLNLEYVPETEKKEPARLIEKKPKSVFDDLENGAIIKMAYSDYPDSNVWSKKETKLKKKRGRPKKM